MVYRPSTMTVASVDCGIGSDGIDYKVIRLSNPSRIECVDQVTGKEYSVMVNSPLKGTHVSKQFLMVDGRRIPVNDNSWYAQPKDIFMGTVFRQEVKPYLITNDKGEVWMLNQLALPVFGDDTLPDFKMQIQQTFTKRGHVHIRTGTYIRRIITLAEQEKFLETQNQ